MVADTDAVLATASWDGRRTLPVRIGAACGTSLHER
jgi:hypothetical protein